MRLLTSSMPSIERHFCSHPWRYLCSPWCLGSRGSTPRVLTSRLVALSILSDAIVKLCPNATIHTTPRSGHELSLQSCQLAI